MYWHYSHFLLLWLPCPHLTPAWSSILISSFVLFDFHFMWEFHLFQNHTSFFLEKTFFFLFPWKPSKHTQFLRFNFTLFSFSVVPPGCSDHASHGPHYVHAACQHDGSYHPADEPSVPGHYRKCKYSSLWRLKQQSPHTIIKTREGRGYLSLFHMCTRLLKMSRCHPYRQEVWTQTYISTWHCPDFF